MSMFENFPYTDLHNLNLDWIIKIAKDFLDQYTHIQQLIADGETSLQNLTEEGLTQLQNKADNLESLLQEWFDTHSDDIANQLANALTDLNAWYTQHQNYLDATLLAKIAEFNTAAEAKAEQTISTIPDDYTALSNHVLNIDAELGTLVPMKTALALSDQGTGFANAPVGVAISIGSQSYWYHFTAPVTAGKYYDFTIVNLDGDNKCIQFTDSNNIVVEREEIPAGTSAFRTFRYQAPVGATKVWVNSRAETGNIVQEESLYPIQDQITFNNRSIEYLTNLDLSNLPSGYINQNGQLVAHTNYRNITFAVVPGSIVIYRTGSTESVAGLVFFDNNGDFISFTSGTTTEQVLTAPADARFVKACFRYSTIANAYLKLYTNMNFINNAIAENNVYTPVYVDSAGRGEYTSLLKALKYTDPNRPIIIRKGIYNIINEYEEEYGSSYFANYVGYDTSDPFDRGLWLAKGRTIIGEPGVEIDCIYEGNNNAVFTYFSVFANTGNIKIENITIKFANVRYAIHDDYSAVDGTIIFKDIRFINRSGSTAIGGGFGLRTKYYIEGCVFDAYGDYPNTWDINYHGSNNASITNVCELFITNCFGNRGCGVVDNGASTYKSPCYVSNSKFDRIVHYPVTEEQTVNIELIAWNNETN